MKVGDLMTTEVLTIGPDAPLKEAATMMVRSGVSGLPVVDDDRKVIGIITEADFVNAEAERAWGRQRRRLLAGLFEGDKAPAARTVADAMTRSPHGIDRDSTITEAARKMTEYKVKRLPVLLPDGTLDGIISRADVMGAFARDDDELRDEVERSVIGDVLQLADAGLAVGVTDGVVSISGNVPTKSEARLLEELAIRVEGVVEVQSHVSWTTDDARNGFGSAGGPL